MTFVKDDFQKKMHSTLDALHKELGGLRTGRASASLVEPLTVEAYDSKMPLTQVATVNVPEPRLITIQVWDKLLVKNVEKAIRDSGLGLNPMTEGQLIRIPLPDLSEERRRELVKVASKYSEQARVALRNVRRDAMDVLKKLKADNQLSEDDLHRLSEDVQHMTDSFVKQVDDYFHKKEKDIMQV